MSLPTPREPGFAAHAGQARAATVSCGTFGTRCAHLDLAVASSRGVRHAVNEDAHSALDGGRPVYVVADGVGGGAMASRASRELVAHLHDALDRRSIDDRALCDALLGADRKIARSIAAHTDQLGAATIAMCASADAHLAEWSIAWVGDCRAYHVPLDPASSVTLLTRDDSYRHLSELPPCGGSPDDPARMVGNGAVAAPNLMHLTVEYGEMLVLCSDGVHKHVREGDMSRLLRDESAALARRCASLVALARLRGSRDDATALVVQRLAPAPRVATRDPRTPRSS